MAINFPSDTSNSPYTDPDTGYVFEWDGEKWVGTVPPVGGDYVLPVATDSVLGGVKVGARLTIDGSGILSADVQGGGSTTVGTLQEVLTEGNVSDKSIELTDGNDLIHIDPQSNRIIVGGSDDSATPTIELANYDGSADHDNKFYISLVDASTSVDFGSATGVTTYDFHFQYPDPVIQFNSNGSATFGGNIEAAGLTDGTTTKTMTDVLAGGASVQVGETYTGSPQEGDLWWDSSDDSGRLYIWYEDGNTNQWVDASPAGSGGGGIAEAPTDGQQYARQNSDWSVVQAGGGGIPEAPTDGKQYARQNSNWSVVQAGDGNTTINYQGAAAWASVSADATNIKGLNIASVVRSGSKYVVTFTDPMPNTDYAVIGSADITSNNFYFEVNSNNKTVNGFEYWMVGPDSATGTGNSAAYFAVYALNALPPKGTTGTDAWGQVTDAGVLTAGYNCTVSKTNKWDGTVVADANGAYYVTFNTAMPSANYSVTGSITQQSFWDVTTVEKDTRGFTVNICAPNVNDGTNVVGNAPFDFQVNATNAQLPATITQEQLDAIFEGSAFNGVAAWGYFFGSADPITSSGLNYSVTVTGAGVYQIAFTTPMPSDNYSITVGGDAYLTRVYNQDANGFELRTINSSSNPSHGYNANFAVHSLNAPPPKGGTGTDAWGTIAGGAGVADANRVLGGFNIQSVQRTGDGQYTINFINDMPNANYSVVASPVTGVNADRILIGAKRTNGFDVTYFNTTESSLNADFNFTVNGTNATLPLTITEDQIAALIQNPTLSAWGSTDGGTPPILRDPHFNIDTIVRNSQGNYTVTFDQPLSTPNYAVSVVLNTNTFNGFGTVKGRTTAGFTVETTGQGGNAVDSPFSVIVAGTARNGTLGGGADAWGSIAQNGDKEGTFNVANVVFNSAGNYTVSFTNPMPNANYSVVATPRTGGTRYIGVNNKTVNGFDVVTFNDSNTSTSSPFSFAVFATDGNAGGFWTKTGDELAPLSDTSNVSIGGGDITLNADGTGTVDRILIPRVRTSGGANNTNSFVIGSTNESAAISMYCGDTTSALTVTAPSATNTSSLLLRTDEAGDGTLVNKFAVRDTGTVQIGGDLDSFSDTNILLQPDGLITAKSLSDGTTTRTMTDVLATQIHAWGTVNKDASTSGALNVSGVSKVQTGVYQVTFADPTSHTTYAVTTSLEIGALSDLDVDFGRTVFVYDKQTSGFKVAVCSTSSSNKIDMSFSFSVLALG